jgi:hypothetical protein
MKNIGKFSFAVLLLAVSLGFSAPQAAADSMLSGTFKLPMQAHWGTAVLPAGDYSYTVEMHGSGPVVAIRTADGKCSGLFFARSVSTVAESGVQSLTLTHVGTDTFVSSFQLGAIGLSLDYSMPKQVTAIAQKAATGLVAERR